MARFDSGLISPLGSRSVRSRKVSEAAEKKRAEVTGGPPALGVGTVTDFTRPMPDLGRITVQPETESVIRPGISGVRPDIVFRPEVFTTLIPSSKTVTALARDSIAQLQSVGHTVVVEAIRTVSNRRIPPSRLLDHLERRTRIGEVLNELPDNWSEETLEDFGNAVGTEPQKKSVMDSIVSLAVLSDPDLEESIRAEHLDAPSEQELLGERTVVDQYPAPGTPLQPPYLVVVAVEHRDVASADEVVKEITGQLPIHEGFRVPKSIVPRL